MKNEKRGLLKKSEVRHFNNFQMIIDLFVKYNMIPNEKER